MPMHMLFEQNTARSLKSYAIGEERSEPQSPRLQGNVDEKDNPEVLPLLDKAHGHACKTQM